MQAWRREQEILAQMDPMQCLAWRPQRRSMPRLFMPWASCGHPTHRHRRATPSPAFWPAPTVSLRHLPPRRSSSRHGPLASFSVSARSPMFDPTVPGLLGSAGKGVACAVI
jgi:hypothetical protein